MAPYLFLLALWLAAPAGAWADGQAAPPVVIAHRGASGYLPEHTLAGMAMAHAMGADYIEQDVVLTADGVPIVLHDKWLDGVTDVAAVFPDRARPDGRRYAIDFRLEEVRRLNVHERTRPSGAARYGDRFPAGAGRFAVPTLAEAIELIQGLNRSTGRRAGIYVEIKYAGFHRDAGRDIAGTVLDLLHRYGYREAADPCFIQSFDPDTLRRIRPKTRLRLVQLIGENRWGVSDADFNAMRTPEGLAAVAAYADGIGPHYRQVITGISAAGRAELAPLLPAARRLGLVVHPYTLRADDLPPWATDFDALLAAFFTQAKVAGVFTDFPDRAVRFLRRNPIDSR